MKKDTGFQVLSYFYATYINKKAQIKLIYSKPSPDADGQTVCSMGLIIVYWNQCNWEWLREVIMQECAHRYDCSTRGVYISST